MVPDAPFARIVSSRPGEMTGETFYTDQRGRVWREDVCQSFGTVTHGYERARIVSGYVIHEPHSIRTEAPAATPKATMPLNRAERRRLAAQKRKGRRG